MRYKLLYFGVLTSLIFLLIEGCISEEANYIVNEGTNKEKIPLLVDASDEELTPAKPFNGLFASVSDLPVLFRGKDTVWDSSLITPGDIVFFGGLYHMFYNGFMLSSEETYGGIGYAVSANGYDWYRVSTDPLLTWKETVGEKSWVRVNSVFVEDDHTWIMFLSSAPKTPGGVPPKIWRATANAPNGPWFFDYDPVLEGGSIGTWDQFGVQRPVVVKKDDIYLMYYTNKRLDSKRGISAIGVALSYDGYSWRKYNDLETGGSFIESDPVLVAGEENWGAEHISIVALWSGSDEVRMLYSEGTLSESRGFGSAISEDGITWKRSSKNPVLSRENFYHFSEVSPPGRMFYRNGIYYFFYYERVRTYPATGDIYLAISSKEE